MRPVLLSLLVILSAVAVSVLAAGPPAPPSQYYAAMSMGVPQWKEVGLPAVAEPFRVWIDSVNKLERVEAYGGLDTLVLHKDSMGLRHRYRVFPEGDKMVCHHMPDLAKPYTIFPTDLDQFVANGTETIDGQLCAKWRRDPAAEGATNTFAWYTNAQTGAPVRYVYTGMSSSLLGYLHSPNYDWFNTSFTAWQPGPVNASMFDVPAACQDGRAIEVDWTPGMRSLLSAFMPPSSTDELWAEWLAEHGHDEELVDREQWHRNLALISHHNRLAQFGLKTYRMALNHLAGEDPQAWVRARAGYRPDPRGVEGAEWHEPSTSSKADLPSAVDWRAKGAVTPIKDQGDCGSCWTFSSTGAVEGAHAIKHGQLIPLSEQFLIDCAVADNKGCYGGSQGSSFRYATEHNDGRWPSETQLPYLMTEDYCKAVNNATVKVVGHKLVTPLDEHALMDALATVGPVSISVDTMHGWTFYHAGVFDEFCPVFPLDHAVLAVGYGTDPSSGKDYWIVKNSWSHWWGEQGYIRIVRTLDKCGVEDAPVYPIVA